MSTDDPDSNDAESNDAKSGTAHYVADADDIPVGDREIVSVDGLEICVFHLEDGFYALSNYCVHQGGPVCEGLISGTVTADDEMEMTYEREDQIVACPWHGWEFDIKTGNHLARDQYRLPQFDVRVDDGEVYVLL